MTKRQHNLPSDVTSFVGRRRELTGVKGLLRTSRLLTLTGMGGVGKTRLAIRAAADLQRGFTGGVWLVELAGLQDGGLVAETVAAALGLQDRVAGGALRALSEFLAERQLLLVLDNCEHLLQACAVLADSLLRGCPGLRILATSRQPLAIAGEQIFVVPPLSVPALDQPLPPEEILRYEALSLFAERAAAVHPAFVIHPGNQEAVVGICRRLDGIPLAIELAAVRLRALSAHQLLERLDDRYGLLIGGSPAVLPRQQTLRALIDWSYELCSPAERLLWERLSIFVDGFDLAAAEEVCSDAQLPAAAVLDLVAGLVDKSVLVVEQRDGRVHYHLPETLREYGRSHLASHDQLRTLRLRHRDWCQQLVNEAEAGWSGPNQVALFARLQLAHANLRAALTCCLAEPGAAQTGLRMASALRFYWLTSGRLNEGRHWLGLLLASDHEPSAARVKGLYVAGYLATMLDDFAAAERQLGEAGQLAEQLEDLPGASYVRQVSGLAMLFQADPVRAAQLFERALADHLQLADPAAVIYDRIGLAQASSLLGNGEYAAELLELCIAATESSGEHWIRALTLWALGVEACLRGDYQQASEHERQSIRLRLPFNDPWDIGLNLDVMAWAAAGAGDCERAARLFGAADAIPQIVGTSLATLGHLAGLHANYQAVARQALGAVAFQRAVQQGLSLSFDEAVAFALGDPTPPEPPVAKARPAAAVPSSLTRREREIAELIARGLSNKEIAAALVIAQRTAEAHVEHILVKLGYTSRVQVASWVVGNRINSDPDHAGKP